MNKTAFDNAVAPSDISIQGDHAASVFRRNQNLYLRQYCSSLRCRKVLNVGAFPGHRDKEGQTYEDYFPKAEFHTLDVSPVDHPRHYVADLMDLSNIDQTFDMILMMSVLEHVEKPFLAAERLQRIMAKRGYLYLALPFFYPIHATEVMGDFWRFAPTSVPQMFEYCDIVHLDRYPSVIKAVDDRKNYWDQEDTTYTGFSALLRKKK